MSAGYVHGLALKSDGTAWSWGFNGYGELGIGVVGGDSILPTQVLSGVTAVAAGSHFAAALKSDGTVWAWGDNTNGQLALGTMGGQYPTPMQVSGLSGVTALAVGSRGHHVLALKSDGTVWAWGTNGNGELGDGTTTSRDVPVQVSGLSGVVAVAAGQNHSLAQTADGTVWGFGANGSGQLGDGTTTQRRTPVATTFNAAADGSDSASWPMPNPAGTGLPHPASYTISTGYVFDELTGLQWEQPALGCGSGCSQANAAAYCAGLTLAGYGDWRLPTRIELVSIVDDTQHFQAIDPTAFPGTSNGYYWASTPMVMFPGNAFSVGGAEGDTAYRTGNVDNVRCVRGTAAAQASQYQIQAGGAVLDTGTGLTWQQAVSPSTYAQSDAQSYCNGNVANLPGSGWRLPSMKELQTLVDDGLVNPAIDPTAFPGTPFDAAYWTSTPVAWQSGYAWYVLFDIGQANHDAIGATYPVRCVH